MLTTSSDTVRARHSHGVHSESQSATHALITQKSVPTCNGASTTLRCRACRIAMGIDRPFIELRCRASHGASDSRLSAGGKSTAACGRVTSRPTAAHIRHHKSRVAQCSVRGSISVPTSLHRLAAGCRIADAKRACSQIQVGWQLCAHDGARFDCFSAVNRRTTAIEGAAICTLAALKVIHSSSAQPSDQIRLSTILRFCATTHSLCARPSAT